MTLKHYATLRDCAVFIFLISMIIYGDKVLFNVTFTFEFILMCVRALVIQSRKREKFYFIATYTGLFVLQILFTNLVIFAEHTYNFGYVASKIIGLASCYVPFIVERFLTINKYVSFYLPSLQEISVVSFAEIKSNRDRLHEAVKGINKAGDTINWENIKSIATDIPRNSSFRYTSNGALSDEYFEQAYKSLEDPYIYIVLSDTGSPASEIISLFTHKSYSHASLAFDFDLKTIVSYNGGERVYPPGLNKEAIEFFNKKSDSGILVYRMKVTNEQKFKIIDKIKEINTEGSAYNLMGLVLKYSHKPNIMFCSQFVYKMLKYAGICYFEKRDEFVHPMDLVELDYHRKLEFAYELKFKDIEDF